MNIDIKTVGERQILTWRCHLCQSVQSVNATEPFAKMLVEEVKRDPACGRCEPGIF